MNNYDIDGLQALLEYGNISTDVLETAIAKMKKEKILSRHNHTITPPTDKKGSRWQTYIDNTDGSRKKVSATSESILLEKLHDYYFVKNAITIESLYTDWLEKRNSENISIRSIQRYKNYWNKYYMNHTVVSVPLEKLTEELIEAFFHESIRNFQITLKELNCMKFLFRDILKMAKKRKLISENPFLNIEISTYACKPAKKKNDASRVYFQDEKEKLFCAVDNELNDHPENTDSYAVLLLFKLGLRIGEIVALKWSDIDYNENSIHIHRMETLEEGVDNKLHPFVADYTKKKSPHGDRFLPLSDYEYDILDAVKKVNESYHYKEDDFIFCDEEGRTKSREIDNRIRKLCNRAGIEEKSAHDIRRTVASEMHSQGIPVEIIRVYLGHSDIKTTWSYISNNQNKEETSRLITNALSGLNGLKGTQTANNRKCS